MKTYDHTPIAERVKNALVISCCIIFLIVAFAFAAGYGAELIMAIL